MDPSDLDAALGAEASMRRRRDELTETQAWVHHVADLDSGKLLTTPLDRPVAPLSRAERLSRLGAVFDPSIFGGGPSYRLSARKPYQASPEAWLAAGTIGFSSYDDEFTWQPPPDPGPGGGGLMRVHFAVSPDVRSVVSLSLSGYSWPGTVGHLRVDAAWSPASIRVPIGADFGAHTVDLTFVPLGGRESEILIFLEAGIRMLVLRSIAFRAQPPVLDPG
jgi:hypothetical protein